MKSVIENETMALSAAICLVGIKHNLSTDDTEVWRVLREASPRQNIIRDSLVFWNLAAEEHLDLGKIDKMDPRKLKYILNIVR